MNNIRKIKFTGVLFVIGIALSSITLMTMTASAKIQITSENVKNLPISRKTVFIRWTYQRSYWDDNSFGPRNTTRLQWMIDFIKNFDNNRYGSYSDLILIDYIK